MTHRNDLIPNGFAAVTPSDTVFVDFAGLYVGSGGNVAVEDGNNLATTFANVPTGFVLAGRVTRVKSTGTTASNIVGFKA